MNQVLAPLLVQSMEDRFRQAITDKYGQQKKHLLPREEYNQTIEDIKTAKKGSKSRMQYHILSRYVHIYCY